MNTINNLDEENNQYTFSELGIEEYLKCALCGHELKFSHQMDYLNLSVKEEAHCVCCKVRLKSREYIMQ